MNINKFIEDFKNQLEDTEVDIKPQTDYNNQDYWDSLTAMVVKVMIEDDYKVDLQPEKITSFSTIQELFDFIASEQKL